MKVFAISLLTVSLSFSLSVVVLAHCGDTWVAQAPTFAPTLGDNGCTAASNPTTTSKSVETRIHWTVGVDETYVITDSGMNKFVPGGFFPDTCIRCFPTFEAPLWRVRDNTVTEWSQVTREQIVNDGGSCVESSRAAIDHHFGRDCSSSEEGECDFYFCDTGCHWDCAYGDCLTSSGQSCYSTPVLIDVSGNGVDLTNAESGVLFDLNNDGTRERLSWTASTADDSWLILDRNGNGIVDNGAELFGNFTPQPRPQTRYGRNGFLALAEYDKPANGGNSDGQITEADAVFPSLQFWHDTNHDGLSQSSELSSLNAARLTAIELDYKTSQRTDGYGNRFTFRAKVRDSAGSQLGRWAWDVILVEGQ